MICACRKSISEPTDLLLVVQLVTRKLRITLALLTLVPLYECSRDIVFLLDVLDPFVQSIIKSCICTRGIS